MLVGLTGDCLLCFETSTPLVAYINVSLGVASSNVLLIQFLPSFFSQIKCFFEIIPLSPTSPYSKILSPCPAKILPDLFLVPSKRLL